MVFHASVKGRDGETVAVPILLVLHDLVDVTPAPVLTRLEGLNDRVVGRVEMPGGVLILRIVTATDMSTDETEAQMHPGITRFQTVLTSIGTRRDVTYRSRWLQ